MLLVDSSVWIDLAQAVPSEAARFIAAHDDSDELATTGIIVQEVLQGARSERLYDALRGQFEAMLQLEPEGLGTYALAAQLYRKARARGLTVRKPNDCLIAALALEHGATLVHNDRDFLAIAQVVPALTIFPGRAH
jgi:predicted nucleic acid-binding protein